MYRHLGIYHLGIYQHTKPKEVFSDKPQCLWGVTGHTTYIERRKISTLQPHGYDDSSGRTVVLPEPSKYLCVYRDRLFDELMRTCALARVESHDIRSVRQAGRGKLHTIGGFGEAN